MVSRERLEEIRYDSLKMEVAVSWVIGQMKR